MNHFIYLGFDLFLTSFFFNVKKKIKRKIKAFVILEKRAGGKIGVWSVAGLIMYVLKQSGPGRYLVILFW